MAEEGRVERPPTPCTRLRHSTRPDPLSSCRHCCPLWVGTAGGSQRALAGGWARLPSSKLRIPVHPETVPSTKIPGTSVCSRVMVCEGQSPPHRLRPCSPQVFVSLLPHAYWLPCLRPPDIIRRSRLPSSVPWGEDLQAGSYVSVLVQHSDVGPAEPPTPPTPILYHRMFLAGAALES